MDSKFTAESAVKLLFEKKGLDVRLYDVTGQSSITDYYINVSARSGLQVCALSDALTEELAKFGKKPLHVEGRDGKNWILIDFGDVIVNVFDRPTRDFYAFDRHLPAESAVNTQSLLDEVNAKFDINRKEQ